MVKASSQIQYMVTIYITAHGRAVTEEEDYIRLTDRDVYIGQEVGNCGVQLRAHDRRLISLVTDWNMETRWLREGAPVGSVAVEDYVVGPRQFEDETTVLHNTQVALVGPAFKRNKMMDMEGVPGETSRPGVVVVIQEKGKARPGLHAMLVRSIMNKIYVRESEELDRDTTGRGHRFSAVYLNNQFVCPDARSRTGALSQEFDEYVVGQEELSLSGIIDAAKSCASRIIDTRRTSKSILYTIADTTCNVYATEDIADVPPADQDERMIRKSGIKAATLGRLLTETVPSSLPSLIPEIPAVTPGHGSEYFYTGTSARLRPRPGDLPSFVQGEEEEEEAEAEAEAEIEDVLLSPDLYGQPGSSATDELPGLSKPKPSKKTSRKHASKEALKKRHRRTQRARESAPTRGELREMARDARSGRGRKARASRGRVGKRRATRRGKGSRRDRGRF